MATHTGVEGVIKIGSNAVAEVVAFSFDISANMIDQSILGSTFRTFKVGTREWKGELTANWDETDTNGQDALQAAILAGTSVTLNLYPEGATTGDTYFTGTAFLSGMSIDVADNDSNVMAKFSFQGSGAIAEATAA